MAQDILPETCDSLQEEGKMLYKISPCQHWYCQCLLWPPWTSSYQEQASWLPVGQIFSTYQKRIGFYILYKPFLIETHNGKKKKKKEKEKGRRRKTQDKGTMIEMERYGKCAWCLTLWSKLNRLLHRNQKKMT